MERDKKSKKAFDEAFDAMDDWQAELAELTERHSEKVFDKLANAAKSVGWPASIVDSSKDQLLQASRMQLEMMEHMVEGWRNNLLSSNNGQTASIIGDAMTGPPADVAKLMMALPQFWIQATATWQKSWTDAMAMWIGRR